MSNKLVQQIGLACQCQEKILSTFVEMWCSDSMFHEFENCKLDLQYPEKETKIAVFIRIGVYSGRVLSASAKEMLVAESTLGGWAKKMAVSGRSLQNDDWFCKNLRIWEKSTEK